MTYVVTFAQADSMAIIFREFSKDYPMWNAAVRYLAQIDALISFTNFSKGNFEKRLYCTNCRLVFSTQKCANPLRTFLNLSSKYAGLFSTLFL